MRPDDIDPLALAGYLSGELATADAARVRAWIDADPAHRALVERLRAAWDRPAPPDFDPDDAVWGRIAAQLDQPLRPALLHETARRTPRTRPGLHLSRHPTSWAAAAVLVVAVGVGLVVVRSRVRPATHTAIASAHDVATGRAQTAALELSDGTRVTLGPETRLTIPAHLGGGPAGTARDLTLVGEGYFEVHHDAAHPFRVHAAGGVAEDVGTAFAIAAYPETGGMQVVVADGVVSLRAAALPPAAPPLATLTHGMLGRVDAMGTVTLTRSVRLAEYVAWTTGGLVFDGTPLRDAVPALARTYDLDIHLADSTLGARHLTATFRDAAPDRVLELLALALDLRVEHRGTAVILHPAH